jgi:hypothetical protein
LQRVSPFLPHDVRQFWRDFSFHSH